MSDEDDTDLEVDGPSDEIGDDWGEALAEQAASSGADDLDPDAIVAQASADAAALAGGQEDDAPEPDPYRPSSFDGSGPGALGDAEENLQMILEIPVNLQIEVGRARIPIRNLLQLSQGSVVELDRLAGEPLDVLVNDTLIAQGEVVVVNDKYGIRLTDIISHADRIKRLAR